MFTTFGRTSPSRDGSSARARTVPLALFAGQSPRPDRPRVTGFRHVGGVRRTVLALAALILGMGGMGIGIGAGPASAGVIGGCAQQLHSFTLDFRTGDDDLRDNSEVDVYVMTTLGANNTEQDIPLQAVYGPFPNNSENYRTVTFQNANWTVPVCSVYGVKLHMISHNGLFQTDDNWNMNSFALYGYSTSGGYAYYVSSGWGNPIKRFTASDSWWTKVG